MKKLFAMLMTMAIAAVLGLGAVGCSKDKSTDTKKVEEKKTTPTSTDKKVEEKTTIEEKK